jgi:hypothetical protein
MRLLLLSPCRLDFPSLRIGLEKEFLRGHLALWQGNERSPAPLLSSYTYWYV